MMKRLLALILTLAVLICLGACAKNNTGGDTRNGTCAIRTLAVRIAFFCAVPPY